MRFIRFAVKLMVVHTATYIAAGMLALHFLYSNGFWDRAVATGSMRPLTSKWVMFGPLFQPVRGFIYALALWPLRDYICSRKYGWLSIWSLFLVFGILGTPGPAPGSMEALIYTQAPFWSQMRGMPEVVLQTLAFSLLVFYWDRMSWEKDKQAAAHSNLTASGRGM